MPFICCKKCTRNGVSHSINSINFCGTLFSFRERISRENLLKDLSMFPLVIIFSNLLTFSFDYELI